MGRRDPPGWSEYSLAPADHGPHAIATAAPKEGSHHPHGPRQDTEDRRGEMAPASESTCHPSLLSFPGSGDEIEGPTLHH